MTFENPVVTEDFDGQILAIDEAIRAAAAVWQFEYKVAVPNFEEVEQTPHLVYFLVNHYSKRGFLVVYDGDQGILTISWANPNMTWLEHRNITRSIPTMIPTIGSGFRAALVYLCMTNGNDLRKHSDLTVQRSLEKSISEAATLGNTELSFGFPDVPAPAVGRLFAKTLQKLIDSGFLIVYDVNNNVYQIKWGQTFNFLSARTGEKSFAFFDA